MGPKPLETADLVTFTEGSFLLKTCFFPILYTEACPFDLLLTVNNKNVSISSSNWPHNFKQLQVIKMLYFNIIKPIT